MTMQLRVFFEFIRRDWALYTRTSGQHLINYILVYPVIFALANGYIFPKVSFGVTAARMASIFYVGSILVVVFVAAFHFNLKLIFDMENDRYVDYQLLLLPPRLIVLENLLFTALITWLSSLLFFPISKLLLRDYFLIPNVSWLNVFLFLLISSLFCSSYHLFAFYFLKSSEHIPKFWLRLNNPMLLLGGFFVPRETIMKFSPILGQLVSLNPILYITEGLRSIMIGGKEFLSYQYCSLVLLSFSLLFYLLALYYFKQRTDHI